MVPMVSVIVPVYNEEARIAACIRSVLAQTVPDFELILVDDASTDHTVQAIQEIADPRISLLGNSSNLGGAASRNKGVALAQGEFIFFLDADCVAAPNWLEEGLKLFRAHDYVGLEGKLHFVSPDYKPTYSDRVVQNLHGGEYMTANMAYRKSALLAAGPFDPQLRRYEDWDMALRVKKLGEIPFVPQMVVVHAHTKWTVHAYWDYAWAVRYDVILFKRHGSEVVRWRIFRPEKILTILLPPLILIRLLQYRYVSRGDWQLFFLMYPRIVYERICLWRECWRQRAWMI
jgi:glycosyltransferase involved in cell wall biosynthesis